ncbi:MAG: translation initiation factor IF-3 [Candidatus Aminicenantia bacterium]
MNRRPHRINNEIRAREVRLIDEDKRQIGIVPIEKAITIAREKKLDLVEIAPQANPPVCRVMNYQKYLYEITKREKEGRKHQKNVQVKEIKFRPKISSHDFQFKLRHIKKFLEDGNKVKVSVFFRGREKAHPEMGKQIIDRVIEETKELASVEVAPKMESSYLYTMLMPKKGGKDAKAQNPQRS